MHPDCVICVNPMPPSKIVTCPFCEFSSCKHCNERYILETSDDPKCMNCNKVWPREVLNDIFTKKFTTGALKRHRENVLMDRERSLLPSTQPAVEQEIRRRDAARRKEELKRDLALLKAEMERTRHEIWQQHAIMTGANETLPEFRTFLHKCPNDSCRGFLSTAYKCSICKMYTCPDCNEIKGDTRDAPHECRPENVLTMNIIRRDCKPCPGCGTQIYRVQGCDQMWCTSCHTPFSWRTGQPLRSGIIHNPHLYEWQQNNPRRAADGFALANECGLPMGSIILGLLNANYRHATTESQKILMIHRFVLHTEHVEIPRFTPNNELNIDLRIKYLLNEISDENWKTELQRREKKNDKYRDIHLLLRAFVDASTDIMRLWVQNVISNRIEPLDNVLSEFDKLRLYVNEQFVQISKRYTNSATMIINVSHGDRSHDRRRLGHEIWSWDSYKFTR